jgi:hypothetical protein
VRQALQYVVEALKNKIDEKRTIQQLLYIVISIYSIYCVLNFTDCGKIRIGLSNNCFRANPCRRRLLETYLLRYFDDSLEINSAWQWCQRDEDHITDAKMVNSFLKINSKRSF